MATQPPVRDRLLDAADEVLFVDGAVSTPVDAILKKAGASPASLYAQFGNKDGLVAAALERRLAEWTEVWDGAIARARDDRGRLLAVFDALHDYQKNRMTEKWCSFSGTAATLPRPTAAISDILRREDTLLRTRLRAYAEPLSDDPDSLAQQVAIAYVGALAMMLREPWEQAIDEGRRTAEALVG